MHDQAKALRDHMQTSGKVEQAQTISFISGKGGVGKSNIAINFAIQLAKKKYRVLLVDLDVGMGNIDILLGVQPKRTFVDALKYRLAFEDIIEHGPGEIDYIAGGSSFTQLFMLNNAHRHYFLSQFDILVQKYDFVLFDMGAGITNESLFFILAADEIMLVTTPEPTSLTDGYSMIKILSQHSIQMPLHIIMNRSTSNKIGKTTLNRFEHIVQSFLQMPIMKLAIIPDDSSVGDAVMRQRPFTMDRKRTKVTIALEEMAATYLESRTNDPKTTPLSFIQKMKQFWRERNI